MAKSHNIYIYNLENRPSKFSFLVAIPFYMYRIQSYDYTDGLNFFQRAVLKFMAKPGVNAEMIANIMDIDIRLVNIVIKQMKEKNFIDDNGLLTNDGQSYKDEAFGVVVNSTEKRIGYVFQMLDRNEYYPFYVKKINTVKSYVNLQQQIGIIFEAEEKDRDFHLPVFPMDIKSEENKQSPSDMQVLQLMENGCKVNPELRDSIAKSYKKCDNLKMEFLPDNTPEKVYVCTYVYLKSLGHGYFDKDWMVSDPFRNNEDSPGLKFYLQSLNDESFNIQLYSEFKNALTQRHKSWSESEQDIDLEVDKRVTNDFTIIPEISIDGNERFKKITRNIIGFIIKHEASEYSSEVLSNEIILYTQRLVELVFEIDSKERYLLYKDISDIWLTEYRTDIRTGNILTDKKGTPKRKPKNLYGDQHFKEAIEFALNWLFTKKEETYYKLKAMADKFDNKNGLYKSIYILFLCWHKDNDDKLIKMLLPHLSFVLDKCSNRNAGTHASLQNDKVLNEKETKNYYEFLKTFVSDYSNYQNIK